jgi:type III pantothenate kinase
MKNSILAIDVGNSHVKYGHFSDGKLIEFWRHDLNSTAEQCEEFLRRVDAPVALASVAPSAGVILQATCQRLGKPLFEVSASAQTVLSGMNNTMGADRVADAVAAWKVYGKGRRPVLIMGFGTATTLLAISKDGHVEGGWIAPGIQPTLEVLHDRCQLLPLLTMEGQSDALGHDTDSHMRNGVFLGHVGLVKQWLATGKRALSQGKRSRVVTVATGGWAQKMQEFSSLFDHVDRELTLRGVYVIAEASGFAAAKPAVPANVTAS